MVINQKKKKIVVDARILFGGSDNSKSAAHQTPFQKRKAQVKESRKYEGTDLTDAKLLLIVQEKLSQLKTDVDPARYKALDSISFKAKSYLAKRGRSTQSGFNYSKVIENDDQIPPIE